MSNTVCEHGSQKRKCFICDSIELEDDLQAANTRIAALEKQLADAIESKVCAWKTMGASDKAYQEQHALAATLKKQLAAMAVAMKEKDRGIAMGVTSSTRDNCDIHLRAAIAIQPSPDLLHEHDVEVVKRAMGEAVAWRLTTGHGTQVLQQKPPCLIEEVWKPLYAVTLPVKDSP